MEPPSAPDENQRLVRVSTDDRSYVFPENDRFRSPTQTKGEIDRQKLQHLKSVQLTAKKLGLDPIDLSQLSQQHPQVTVRVVATIADVRQEEDQPEGDRLTFLELEDLTGSAVAIVKPDLYHKIGSPKGPKTWENSFIILWGKAQQQEAQSCWLMVEDAVQIEPNYLVMLKLTDKIASNTRFHERLHASLKELSGETNKPKVPVIAIVEGKDFHLRRLIRFGHQFWVQDPVNAVKFINKTNTSRPATLLDIPVISSLDD